MRKIEVNNGMDVIDSRDIIARIEELESELQEAYEDEGNTENKTFEEWLDDMAGSDNGTFEEAAKEYQSLKALENEAKDYSSDWTDGAALIRDDYFEEYTEELLKDIGDLPRDLPGYIVIDWAATADNIKQDYTSVEFDGVTYWVR